VLSDRWNKRANVRKVTHAHLWLNACANKGPALTVTSNYGISELRILQLNDGIYSRKVWHTSTSTQEPMCLQRTFCSAFLRVHHLVDVQDFVNSESLANSDSIIVFRPLSTRGEVPVPLPSLTAADQIYPFEPHFSRVWSPSSFQDSSYILRNSISVCFPPE